MDQRDQILWNDCKNEIKKILDEYKINNQIRRSINSEKINKHYHPFLYNFEERLISVLFQAFKSNKK